MNQYQQEPETSTGISPKDKIFYLVKQNQSKSTRIKTRQYHHIQANFLAPPDKSEIDFTSCHANVHLQYALSLLAVTIFAGDVRTYSIYYFYIVYI